MEYTIKESRRYAEQGRLFEWVVFYLTSIGGNEELARSLTSAQNQDSLRLCGLEQYPLRKIKRCCGPEEEMTYRQSHKVWERQISGMSAGMASGWEPPPIIVGFVRNHTSVIALDGNHRHEVLVRAGATKYWTILCSLEKGLGDLSNYILGYSRKLKVARL